MILSLLLLLSMPSQAQYSGQTEFQLAYDMLGKHIVDVKKMAKERDLPIVEERQNGKIGLVRKDPFLWEVWFFDEHVDGLRLKKVIYQYGREVCHRGNAGRYFDRLKKSFGSHKIVEESLQGTMVEIFEWKPSKIKKVSAVFGPGPCVVNLLRDDDFSQFASHE